MLDAVLRNDFNVTLQKHAADQVWSSYNKILHKNFFIIQKLSSVPGKTVVCETTTGVISDIYMNIELRCIKLFSWLK